MRLIVWQHTKKAIDSDVMIEVNVFHNNPRMWADLVRYANREKGYGFKYWEIGNENEAAWNDYLTPIEYMKRFTAYKSAMEAVDPSIVIVGGGFSSATEYSINNSDNLVREMGEIAKVGDGITWHWYMEHDSTTIGNFMRYTNPESNQPWDNKYSGSRQWPDYIVPRIKAEQIAGRSVLHGVTELNTASENRAHLQQNHISAMMVSDALPRLAMNGVDFANFWLGFSQKGSSFAMIQHDEYNFSTEKLVNVRLNSPWYVYYMFQKYFGEDMVATTVSDKEKMSVWAAKDPSQPGKLMVWVTNFTSNPISADLELQNFVAGSGEAYELLPDSPLPGLNENGDVDIYSNINGRKIDIYSLQSSIDAIQSKPVIVNNGGFNRVYPAYSVTAIILDSQGTPLPSFTPTPTLVPGASGVPTYTPGPTSPPQVTVTFAPQQTPFLTPTLAPQGSVTPTPTEAIRVPQESPVPTITVGNQGNCPRKGEGDANCDNRVNLIDYEIVRTEFLREWSTQYADFNKDGNVSLIDAKIWVNTFIQGE